MRKGLTYYEYSKEKEHMIKHIPNAISISRIFLVIALLFTFHNTLLFLFLYIICGLSDVLDGYIARKTKTESELGAKLDSIADFALFVVITVSIIIWMGNKITVFIPLIIVIALIRIANIAIASYKYHFFATLHTWGNKLTGLLLFFTPLFIFFQRIELLWFVCVVAFLSTLEEIAIHITSTKLHINRRSIFRI